MFDKFIPEKTKSENVKEGFETLVHPMYDDPFNLQLETLIEEMQDTGVRLEHFNKLSDMIYDRFGFRLLVKSSDDGFACIPPAVLTEVNVPVGDIHEVKPTSGIEKTLLENYKILKSVKIKIDYEKAKVLGVPKNVKGWLFIDSNEIEGNHLSKKEIAAVIMHEIGHCFTSFEFMAYSVQNNIHLIEAWLAAKSGNLDKVIKELEIVTGEKIDKLNKKDQALLAINTVNRLVEPLDNLLRKLGTDYKNNNQVELNADDFAVRFGYGEYLATGLIKYFNPEYKKIFMSGLLGLINLTLMILFYLWSFSSNVLFTFWATLFLIGSYLLINILIRMFMMDAGRYDKFPDRIKKIKLDLIRILRSYKLNKKDLQETIKQIDALEEIMKKLEEESVFSFLIHYQGTGFNFGATLKPSKEIEKLIEELIDNDFHYLGKKIELGAEELTLGNEEYVTKLEYWPPVKLFKASPALLDEVNKYIKSKYNLELKLGEKNIRLISDKDYDINNGVATTAITLDDTVILLTSDIIKFMWLNRIRDRFNVLNTETFTIPGLKPFYVIEVDKLEFPGRNNKHIRYFIETCNRVDDRISNLYGYVSIKKELEMILDEISDDESIHPDLRDQVEALYDFVRGFKDTSPLVLDIHYGNVGINSDGSLIISDPIYDKRNRGYKLPTEE